VRYDCSDGFTVDGVPPSGTDLAIFSNSSSIAARVFDALVFSAVWAAGVAAALVFAVSHALDVSPRWDVIALAFTGALVVYPIDRLRDIERDRRRAPLRSAFVGRHRRFLRGLVLLSGVASCGLAWRFGTAVWLLCGGVLIAGMLHRRLKRVGRGKAIYVSLAWTSVVVGLPALAQHPTSPARVLWAATVIYAAVFANLVASNLAARDASTTSSEEWPEGWGRRLALSSAVLGTAIGLVGPAPALSAVPCAQALVLIPRMEGERYTQGIVDGALLVGGLVASGLSRISG